MQSASYEHQKRMSMILSRVNRSESRDEIISGVQNQKFHVATRSTAAIATSTNGNSLIGQSWTALLLHLRHSTSTTFQMFHGDVKIVENNQRKRPFAIESDERIDFTAASLSLNKFPQHHFLAP